MSNLTPILLPHLEVSLADVDEIWIATGLLNLAGLNSIITCLPERAIMHFIVGIDLPTEPRALLKLLNLSSKRAVDVNMLTVPGSFFHPKVYIIRKNQSLIAYVGSANCTNGGLRNNIEMSLATTNERDCQDLIQWFEHTLTISLPLSSSFIKAYIPKYEKRISRNKEDRADIKQLKKSQQEKFDLQIEFRSKLERALLKFRKSPKYEIHKASREQAVKRIRKSLGYPNFIHLNLDDFFQEEALGTIHRRFVEPSITRNKKKFASLMKFITDESIPIHRRMDEGMNGRFALRQISQAFLSKVLVAHRPQLYYLHNDVSHKCLDHFGLTFSRGMSFGKKYQFACEALRQIMIKTGIDDFATMDECLWGLKHDLKLD